MRKLYKLILLLTAAVSLLIGTAAAASDPVAEFADAIMKQQDSVVIPVRDYDQLVEQTFTRFPQCYAVFASSNYRSVPEGLEIYLTYRDVGCSPYDIKVAHSSEEITAIIGLAMCDMEQDVCFVVAPDCTDADISDIEPEYLRLEHEYYMTYQGYWSYTYTYTTRTLAAGDIYYIDMNMSFIHDASKEQVQKWRDDTEAEILRLSGTLFAQDMPDYMKELLIHDYLANNNYYDTLHMDDAVNHVAYSALLGGKSVCQGYAEATHLLMKAAGLNVMCVAGDAGGAHQWNAVEIGGEWYLYDVTWDDPAADDGSDLGLLSYDYFNVTSSQLAQDHTWASKDSPDCTATEYNADRVRELVDSDTNTYTDYSTENAETVERDREIFLGIVSDPIQPEEVLGVEEETSAEEPAAEEAPDLNEEEDETAPVSEEEPSPEDDARVEQIKAVVAEVSEDQLEDLGIVETKDDIVVREHHSEGVNFWVVILLIVLAEVIVILIVQLTMRKRLAEAREEREDYRRRHIRFWIARGRKDHVRH